MFQMYSKIDDLKIIQLRKSNPAAPLPFIGVINHTITTGLIISSKIVRSRKDGMSYKYFKNNYIDTPSLGKILKEPLTIEFKASQLLSKKYIKSDLWLAPNLVILLTFLI